MATCQWLLVNGCCQRLLVNGYLSMATCQWLLVNGYLSMAACQRLLVQGSATCPRQGRLSKSRLLVNDCLSKSGLLVEGCLSMTDVACQLVQVLATLSEAAQ